MKKKRVLSLLLLLCMLVSLMPGSALAEEPAYEEPAYEEPAYEEPAYEEPAYEEPSYEEPAYEEPAYEEPAYEEPAYEEPAYEEPAYEEPAYEEPAYEEPAYEEPAYEEPVYEEPAYEEPAYEEPANEDSTAEAPTTEEPAYEEPANEEPANGEPEEDEPADAEPADADPDEEEPSEEAEYTEPAAEPETAEEADAQEMLTDLPVHVIFSLTPPETALTVYKMLSAGERQEMEAEEDGSYLLMPDTYCYDAHCDGYEDQIGTEITVDAQAELFPVTVVLTPSAEEATNQETGDASEPDRSEVANEKNEADEDELIGDSTAAGAAKQDAVGADVSSGYELEPPSLSVTTIVGGIQSKWEAVSGAEKYRLLRKVGDGSWERVTDTTALEYTDSTTQNNTRYSYAIRCITGDGTKYTSDSTVKAVLYLDAPEISAAENVNDGVQLRWNAVPGASEYHVSRRVGEGSWEELTNTFALSFTDKTAQNNTEYSYAVRCAATDGTRFFSGSSVKSIRFIAAPTISTLGIVSGTKQVRWGAIAGAEKYRVLRKTGSGSWERLADTTELIYTDSTAENNVSYSYAVRCVTADGSSYTSGSNVKSVVFTDPPNITKLECIDGGVKIEWGALSNAVKYRVLRKTDGGSWQTLTDTTGTSYTDTGAKSNTNYSYTVRSISGDGKSYTSGLAAKTILYISTPTITSAGLVTDQMKLTWNKVDGAAKYRVLKKTESGSWTALGDTTACSYTDNDIQQNTRYSYAVRCITADGAAYTSGSAIRTLTFTDAPTITGLGLTNNGMQFTWNKVNGAAKYRVLRKTEDGSWVIIKDTTGVSYTDENIQPGTKYSYAVRCITGDGTGYTSGSAIRTITYTETPTITMLGLANDGMQLNWNKVSGAVKYRVLRKVENGSWEKAADTTAQTYKDTTVKTNTKYSYAVRCITGDGTGYTSGSAIKTITYTATPAISKIENVNGGVRVTWDKVTGAVKYRVLRKTGSGSWVKIADTTSLTYTDKDTDNNTRYSYAIRSITSDGTGYTSGAAGKAITYISAPWLYWLQSQRGTVTVSWGGVDGAEKYRVYRKSGSGSWTALGDTAYTSWDDNADLVEGRSYTYTVRCVSKDGKTTVSAFDPDGVTIQFHTLSLVSADTGSSYNNQNSIAVSPGATVTLKTVVDKSYDGAVLTYQWSRYGYDENGEHYWEGLGTGATQTTAPINRTCYYQCRLSDQYGNIAWCGFTLYIENHLRVISTENSSKWRDNNIIYVANSGDTATLKVKVSADDLTGLNYQWYRSTNLNNGDNSEKLSGKTTASITTEPITEETFYYCEVTDRYGTRESCYYTLRVDNKLCVTCNDGDPWETIMLVKNQTYPLTAHVSANNKTGLTYQWYKGEYRDFDMSYSSILGATGATLTTDRAVKGMIYRCDVTDLYGSVVSCYYTIGIQNNLWIEPAVGNGQIVYVTKGKSATLKVNVGADDKTGITYEWRESVYIEDQGGAQYGPAIKGATSNTYTTPAVNERKIYYVCATDRYGNTASCSFQVTFDNGVTITANTNRFPVVASGTKITMAVNVSAGDTAGLKYQWYKHSLINGRYTNMAVQGANQTSLSAIINENTEYGFVVTDRNGAQYSIWFCPAVTTFVSSKVTLNKVTPVDGAVQLEWTALKGAGWYQIQRKEQNGDWVDYDWMSGTVYTDTHVVSGRSYSYRVYAGWSRNVSNTSAEKSITYTAMPRLTSVSNIKGGVQMNWNAVSGAAKYRVFRKTASSGWTQIADTTAVSYVDKTAASGTSYTYTVRCLSSDGNSYTSAFDTDGKTITYIAAPVLSSPTVSAGSVTVKWSAVSGASVYRVLRKTEGGSWVGLVNTTSLSYVDKTVAAGTKYTYTVRCMSSDGKTVISAHDPVGKTVTAK